MGKYKWIKNKRYYYYGTYKNWKEAYNTARWWNRKNGSKYWIQKRETFWTTQFVYDLYLTGAGTLL